MISNPKDKAYRNKKYLEFVRKQPPLLHGYGDIVSHHVRIDGNAGVGMKPGDNWTIPYYKSTHDSFHAGKLSDREFFELNGIDIYRELFRLVSAWVKL